MRKWDSVHDKLVNLKQELELLKVQQLRRCSDLAIAQHEKEEQVVHFFHQSISACHDASSLPCLCGVACVVGERKYEDTSRAVKASEVFFEVVVNQTSTTAEACLPL